MKKISFVNLPFNITLVSIFLPLIAAYFFIELHRIILVITVFLFFILFISKKKKMIFSKSNILFLFLLLLFMSYDQATGRGLFYFSHSHFIIYIFVFFHCFLFDENRFSEKLLICQVSRIYSIILFFMLVELFIQLSGNVNLLVELFPIPDVDSVITTYRIYNNRFGGRLLGLQMDALNSLILGNQIGSQLNLNEMLWFFPFYYFIKLPEIFKRSNLWFFIAFILFILSPTMTANVLFIISFFLLVFYIPISRINNLKGKISIVIISVIGFSVMLTYLFPIFFDGSTQFIENLQVEVPTLGFYIYVMTYPIFIFNDLPLWEQIFGRVHQGWAELGYFKLLISTGALWVFTMSIALFVIVFNAFRLSKNINLKEKTPSYSIELYKNWIWIAQVNALICLMYFLSLIHYITILRLGVIQLFSLHIAIAMFATRKAKMLQNNTTDVNINIHKILPI